VTVGTTPVYRLYAYWGVVSTLTRLRMHVLLMLTLHASVCMPVTAYILMSTLHVACVSMYTNFVVRRTHRRRRCMRQCVRLHSLLMLTVHKSACKPINAYKLTCLHMQFLLMRTLLASVQAVCKPVSTGDVNVGMCKYVLQMHTSTCSLCHCTL